jgi:GT2 family glycosyltransferase
MAGPRPTVSVIIPTWNGARLLPDCLESLRRQTYPPLEVIVADGASTDDSAAVVRERFPGVRWLALPENRGFTGNVNAGLRAARGEILALLNNDAEADPAWLAELVRGFEADPGVGLCASKILLYDRRDVLNGAGDVYYRDGTPNSRGVWETDHSQYDTPEYVFGASGGAAAYRRSMLADVGLFDERLFMYCEDVDLSFRAQLRGYRCRYVPTARVYHRLSATGGGALASYYCGRNFVRVVLQNAPAGLLRRHGGQMLRAQLGLAWEALRHGREPAARARLRGQLAALAELPAILRRRRAVQAGRRVTDEYVESILSEPPPHHAAPRAEPTSAPCCAQPAIDPSHDATLTVILVNYYALDYLVPCLAALEAAPPPVDYCIVLVDNSPGDGVAEAVRARFPSVEIISNAANVGFARACNQVLRATRSPYALLLNPDAEVQPGALETLLETLRANPRVAAVGPRLVYPDGRYQHSAFRLPDFAQAFFGFFSLVPLDSPWNGRYPLPADGRPRAVEHLLGACLLLRREALDEVGVLDDRFFIYFEETDWCARALRAGWELWQVPRATVVHHGGGTTRRVAEEMSLQFHRSQAYYYHKHHGRGGYLALKAIVGLGVSYRLARSLLATMRRRIPPDLLATRARVYWGILWA